MDQTSTSTNSGSTQLIHTIHIIPQSHIDVVWLWRYDPETIHHCCKMTFTQALDNLDRFPEYTFAQSQVPLYEPMQSMYPDIFRRIEAYIQSGRWEVVGGMYVEPEGGEPCGESWVRQCVMGKRWFNKTFGLNVTTGWQPDAWGHPCQLPQIMAKCGIHSYLWRRGDVGGPRNNVTEKLFWWQSPDSSYVLAYRFVDPEDPPYPNWQENVRISREKYHLNDSAIVIGWGDHGGGPSANDIQATLEFARTILPGHQVQFSSFRRYIDAIVAQNPPLPVIQGDLGYELQGDLTNVGEIKKNNREGENLLMTAEKWASAAALWSTYSYPAEELDAAWKKLLFNQFHDILGGSLIPEAIDDALCLYQSVRDTSGYTIQDALHSVVQAINTDGPGLPIVVFNPLSWTRTDAVEVTLELDREPNYLGIKDERDRLIPFQILDRTPVKKKIRVTGIFLARDVPSLGYKTFFAVESDSPLPVKSSLTATKQQLENEHFIIAIDPSTGNMSRIFDKQNNREVLPRNESGNQLIAIEDKGDSEGRFVLKSDIIGKPPGREEAIEDVSSIQVLESGPVRAKLRIEKTYQNSMLVQDIILVSGSDRLDFHLHLDWHDIHRMIKVAFPLALKNPQATYDVPYAALDRPGDGLEYPAQFWVDLYADEYGASLINNGRYGHDVQNGTVRLSVLRSPTHPAYNTDEGTHELDYALYPHRYRWNESSVKQHGYEVNYPLMAVTADRHNGTLPSEQSFISIQPEHVIVEVIKKAYDSDRTIIRLYETTGHTGTAILTFPAIVQSACETDMLENDLHRIPAMGNAIEFSVTPYEIKTIGVTFQ